MAKRRGEQKIVQKKKATQRQAAITPARWFNVILNALLLGMVAIAAYLLIRRWL